MHSQKNVETRLGTGLWKQGELQNVFIAIDDIEETLHSKKPYAKLNKTNQSAAYQVQKQDY